MINFLLQAIPAVLQTAKGVSDYFNTRKQKADTSAVDRFINNVKSQSANNASYNIARSNLSRQVNTGLNTAQESLKASQNRSGTAGTPFATRQDIALEQGALESLSQGAGAIEAQQMQQQDIAKQRLADAQMQKDAMIQQFNAQKKQQQGEQLSNIVSGVAGIAGNVLQGLQTSKQNKEILTVLSEEYKNRGLDENTIATISSKYADNPKLAQMALENKAITGEISAKAPAIRQTIDYALSDAQRDSLDAVQNNPGLQIQLMQAYSNDPIVEGRLSAQQKIAYQETFKPELLKQAKSFNITNAENLTFDQLQNNIDLQNTAMKTIESYTPKDKGKFTLMIESGKTPLQAVNQVNTDNEFAQFNAYLSTYPSEIKNKKQVKNISTAITNNQMTASEGRIALEQLAQTYKPEKPTNKPDTKQTQISVNLANSVGRIKTNASKLLTDEYFRNNDKGGEYKSILNKISATSTDTELSNAIAETQKKIISMNEFISGGKAEGESKTISKGSAPGNNKQVYNAKKYVAGLQNILKELQSIQESHSKQLVSNDVNDLFTE